MKYEPTNLDFGGTKKVTWVAVTPEEKPCPVKEVSFDTLIKVPGVPKADTEEEGAAALKAAAREVTRQVPIGLLFFGVVAVPAVKGVGVIHG